MLIRLVQLINNSVISKNTCYQRSVLFYIINLPIAQTKISKVLKHKINYFHALINRLPIIIGYLNSFSFAGNYY